MRIYAAFLGCCLIWGSTFLAIRLGNEAIAPVWGAAVRLVLAAVLLAIITRALRLPLPRGAVLLARSDRAAAEPAAILRGRGALVGEVVAYRTVALPVDRVPAADAVVFASPSAVEGFAAAGTRPGVAIAIGPATADRVRALLGTEPVVATPDDDGLARTIQSALEGHRAAIGR